ncbi:MULTISPECIES: SUKH-4 family immunity protein [Bacillus cereus group]|uniref:SUKH-4 family immunity protein n=1 Tax=Bacillus cereus group TaxID=86661 RepID=UPI0011A1E746|nr:MULTISPECIES: SUKH-4 family immunity protein [Bacillus cereus group]MEA1011646.1 SUKH-4 family immunity protein [Bacillus cereus]
MILPEDFREKWDVNKDGPLITFHEKELMDKNFSDEVKRFLSIGGLPETPSPYLEFTSSQSCVRSIINVFHMPEEFRKYLYLGTTSSGDPICIIEKQENIVFLNNSDEYKEVFMNSSIHQFAECLLVYSKMIDKAVEINGEDAFIDNNIPEFTISWLKEELKKIDNKCMEKDSFWLIEIENLYE